jgi:hypothetical protein
MSECVGFVSAVNQNYPKLGWAGVVGLPSNQKPIFSLIKIALVFYIGLVFIQSLLNY